ncbi:MAG: transposase [bacterium]|nr:transposase [bacterium]
MRRNVDGTKDGQVRKIDAPVGLKISTGIVATFTFAMIIDSSQHSDIRSIDATIGGQIAVACARRDIAWQINPWNSPGSLDTSYGTIVPEGGVDEQPKVLSRVQSGRGQAGRGSGYPVKDVAERIGVPAHTLYLWVRHAKPAAPESDEVAKLKLEIQKLKADLKRAQEERDILKKAAAYFAKDHE